MNELTHAAVAAHAKKHGFVMGPIVWGIWRFFTEGLMPALYGVRISYNGNILVRVEGSPLASWLVYRAADWPGTWTPVRANGEDLAVQEIGGGEVSKMRASRPRSRRAADAAGTGRRLVADMGGTSAALATIGLGHLSRRMTTWARALGSLIRVAEESHAVEVALGDAEGWEE